MVGNGYTGTMSLRRSRLLTSCAMAALSVPCILEALLPVSTLTWGLPMLSVSSLCMGAAVAWVHNRRYGGYPLHPSPIDVTTPKSRDRRDQGPGGTHGPGTDKGIALVGHEMETGREVWLSAERLCQHTLFVGSTGAGKTECLLGFAGNALSWGSGFIFIDGKGDVSVFARVAELCRRWGRSHDLLVLNFLGGNGYAPGVHGMPLSHTMNPFHKGRPDELAALLVSLLMDTEGDGAMWKSRFSAMLNGVMRALCDLRDGGFLTLDVEIIRSYMSIGAIVNLSQDERVSHMGRRSLKAYLSSLPGYVDGKAERQAQTTLDQHGYLHMQAMHTLGFMSDVYGHIFKGEGQVDMDDVVLNHRILVVLLPALEKSGDEVSKLGKILLGSLKLMMGQQLGSSNQMVRCEDMTTNDYRRRPPFMVICDEVGYYLCDGMAHMAAAAGSLNIAMVYSTQDIPAMKRNNEKEAMSILANTNTKVFMRSCEGEMPSLVHNVSDKPKSERISFRDLKRMDPGEATISSGGVDVHSRLLYMMGGSKRIWDIGCTTLISPVAASEGDKG